MPRVAPVIVIILLVACDAAPRPSGSTSDSTASTASPGESESVSVGDVRSIAWWATETLGFGVIPEAPPDPDPPVQPPGFRQLTVGTLDGRITAVLALHSDWGHSYVAGPYGEEVLVANDAGFASEVFTISARDGSLTDLFSTPEIVAAAAIGDDGNSIYYVEVDRDDGTSRGLWRRDRDGERPRQVMPGPIGQDEPDPEMYWITADPLDGRLVVQRCFGQIRCASFAVDTATGQAIEETGIGWPLGADATTLIADGVGDSADAYAWDLRSGDVTPLRGAARAVPVWTPGGWRFVRDEPDVPEGATMIVNPDGGLTRLPGDDPEGSTIAALGERRGVSLPEGWALRWPLIPIQQITGPMGPSGTGQLIRIDTATRIPLEPLTLPPPSDACEVPAPERMPSGRRPGFAVFEFVDAMRTFRWGADADTVTIAMGAALGDPAEDVDGVPVEVRGSPGRVILIGDEGVGEVAFTWSDGECAYTAWLPQGTALEAAVEYAEGY